LTIVLHPGQRSVRVLDGDLSEELLDAASAATVVAVDIETSGLDWTADDIASVQVAAPGGAIEIVRGIKAAGMPHRLVALLQSPDVLKVFHHAMFDLRFLRRAWGVSPARVSCTKVASKIADPEARIGHSLIDLLAHYLGVRIDKTEQRSDWSSAELSSAQIQYAANDVRYLPELLYAILNHLRRAKLEALALRCFDHIPTRVELEVRGFHDVFTY
jgi:ribonuclease D